MAMSNRERIDSGLEQMRLGLVPFVERVIKAHFGDNWVQELQERYPRLVVDEEGSVLWDTYALFRVIWDRKGDAFDGVLGHMERNYVSELMTVRNEHAHERAFSYEDTQRYLDTMRRLLLAVNRPEQAEVVTGLRKKLLEEIQRAEAKGETRKAQRVEGAPLAGLKPWREVITPHEDVSQGRYMEAEFAADLDLVHKGRAPAEYGNAHEFFARTFVTDGLRELLTIGARRLTAQDSNPGSGADPVIDLQTNFGGGKTHSMLALYHLFGGSKPNELPGLEELLLGLGITTLPKARRVVLVGVNMGVAEVRKKEDGCEVRTLWGELAWQLGGREGLAMVANSDKAGTSPGKELLNALLTKYSPCLVLIDEWVAMLRQLPDEDGLAAGSFGANITFAQELTEAVKGVPRAFLVASLPQSSIEVGGTRGERALKELSNVIKRIAKPWRPATTDEGFEIVRRRLFQTGMNLATRDSVVKAFSDMYRDQPGDFPSECRELAYRKKMEASYPIHPELFLQFEQAWATLEKFQRTRGILRLMAAVIHELWQRDDRNLLVMPSSITLDASRVMSLITECLPDGPQWEAVISKDIDGSGSLPQIMDTGNPGLGRYSASRRVARTIFMGSAPTINANSPGLDDQHLRLGCCQPGETSATFGDALRRLTDQAVHLYVDKGRYWYSLKATVGRLARERAEQLKGTPEVKAEIVRRLRQETEKGGFGGIHVAPEGSGDIVDETHARLVILGPDSSHIRKKPDSSARVAVEAMLTTRGNTPRIYRNTLAFLAPDAARLTELDESIRQYMAWKSIDDEVEGGVMDISSFAKGQARTKTDESDRACRVRLMETWSWILMPLQEDAMKPEIAWVEYSVPGGDSLAPKVSKKLIEGENLMTVLGASRLKMELDRYLWKNSDHVSLKHVADCFATYIYLPRLTNRDVLVNAVKSAFSDSLICEYFAYASSHDQERMRYAGLQITRLTTHIQLDGLSVLVKPLAAEKQQQMEQQQHVQQTSLGLKETPAKDGFSGPPPAGTPQQPQTPTPPKVLPKTRFYGTITLNPTKAGLEFSDIQAEIIQQFTSKVGTKVKIMVEIQAESAEGFDPAIIRSVSENCKVLKLTQAEFST
jgi:predicted AAA+ superfamily ATPase